MLNQYGNHLTTCKENVLQHPEERGMRVIRKTTEANVEQLQTASLPSLA
jgi:hypothetical protein